MAIDDYKDRSYEVKGISDTMADMEEEDRLRSEEALDMEGDEETLYSSLANHILIKFELFKSARQTAGVEDDIVNSQRAFNSEYNSKDLARIREEGGSEIFMAITNTKCRAAASWIRDILMNPNVDPFLIEPGSKPDLPPEVKAAIQEAIQQEVAARKQQTAEQNQQPQDPNNPQPKPQIKQAEETLRDTNQLKRDVEDAVYEEIRKEGIHQIKQIERLIKDQLEEGDWQKALSDFIDDFVVYPVAIMKGPIITKNVKITYENGIPVSSDEFVFMNRRVSPLDFYPSPESTDIQGGELIEHLRMSKHEIEGMRGLPYYNDEMIDKILEDPSSDWVNITNIEDEKAEMEKRGTQYDANQSQIHGMHYFGKVSGEDLVTWGAGVEKFEEMEIDPLKQYEVEAILAGSEVIKCQINSDPQNRRPYYKASYCNIPGAFWGHSLPMLINDDQRMCNATARSLANNMGISSGPQAIVFTDRMADNRPIEQMKPFNIWQATSDPTGGGGKPVDFFTVPSIANELMAVYDKFEEKADTASGIPRYAHGNQNTQGAASTAAGLSMLLENLSKSIKDSIRNIDTGLIIPRINYQFYYNILKNPELKYTGDVNVVAIGSSALTIKGSQQLRRNEFLSATANPTDMAVLGVEGRAEILRVMGEDLGLGKNIIPDNLELRRRMEEEEAKAQKQAEAAGSEKEIGLKATELQVNAQQNMHQQTQQMKGMELQFTQFKEQMKQQSDERDREHEKELTSIKAMFDTEITRIKEANANAREKAKLENR